MASVGSFKQQPGETLDYDIDFTDWLPTNDTITSAAVSVEPPGLGLSFSVQSPRVKVWCYNGTSGTAYKVTVRATTNDARVKEVEFKLRVKEE